MSTTDTEAEGRTDADAPTEARLPADIASIVERLAESASVRSVYGESITADDKTVVPVARIAYGFGGGAGTDGTSGAEGEGGAGIDAGAEQGSASGGSGAGGGVMASPAGALEITDEGTRFVRYADRRWLLAAGLVGLVVGFLAGRR